MCTSRCTLCATLAQASWCVLPSPSLAHLSQRRADAPAANGLGHGDRHAVPLRAHVQHLTRLRARTTQALLRTRSAHIVRLALAPPPSPSSPLRVHAPLCSQIVGYRARLNQASTVPVPHLLSILFLDFRQAEPGHRACQSAREQAFRQTRSRGRRLEARRAAAAK
jgi:hypothetical protein